MKHILALLFCCVIFSTSYSQKLKLGKVTVEELEKKQSTLDPDAPAEYIFRKGQYSIDYDSDKGFFLRVQVDTKIKIYTKEGYDLANYEFPVYTGGQKVQALYTDAYTYNLVDGKIEKTKLKSDGEFTEVVNDNFELRKIKMPNVKEGSVVEFSYIYKTIYYRSLPEWFFQYKIPIENCELSVITPEYQTYNIHLKPFLEVEYKRETVKSIYNYLENVDSYKVSNVPAFKDESFVANVNNFISSVRYEISSIRNPTTFAITSLAKSWEDVAKDIYKDDDFGDQLKVNGYFEEDLANYITENASKYDKTTAIFKFVQERMNWNTNNGKYTELGVKKAYKERVGNSADINLMLVAMFRSNGIQSNPVLVSTRSNGISFFPNVAAYNYVLAAVETDKELFLFDATSKNTSVQILPFRALNWFGRMLYSNGTSKEVDLTPLNTSKSITNGIFEIDAQGVLTGKYRETMTEYNAFLYRENYGIMTKESNIERLEKKYNTIEIEDLTVQNVKDVKLPIIEEVQFKKTNAADIIGDKIYLNPLLLFGIKTSPFKSEKRSYPIDFNFSLQDKYLFNIKLPEGYEVESLPESTILNFENNYLKYSYQVKNLNNLLQISTALDINSPIIPAEQYNLIKDFFSKMVEKNNEQIVLKKI